MVELFLLMHTATRFFKGFFAHFYLKKKVQITQMLPTQGYPPSRNTNKDSASWLVHSFHCLSPADSSQIMATSTQLVWLSPDSKAETSCLPGWSPPDSVCQGRAQNYG
ncbi:unnamed protein product [Staurois parvus]|uniref:Uncharacterized protein n=1 Tax=Staurois parvus TaxID=386267 RepID=A0ABN9D8D2_9NEOB|nr:unnamed protein product [Staurois parvus]